jgi:hypothetical protein
MQLAELLPHLKHLPHADQLLLLHFIQSELLQKKHIITLKNQSKLSSKNSYNYFEDALLAKALSDEKTVKPGRSSQNYVY